MNWAKGLTRPWFVTSLAWISYVGWSEWTFIYVVISDSLDLFSALTDLRGELVLALTPPILALLIGYSIFWSVKGFGVGKG